jgi:hypothetical protein
MERCSHGEFQSLTIDIRVPAVICLPSQWVEYDESSTSGISRPIDDVVEATLAFFSFD